MQTGSRIRNLARALDASGVLFWWIGADGQIRYVSGAAAEFLGIADADQLVGAAAAVGVAKSDDPVQRAAAMLAPPPGLRSIGWRHSLVTSPARNNAAQPVHHIALPDGGCVAIGGTLAAVNDWEHIVGKTRARQTLDDHRRGSHLRFKIVTAGISPQSSLVRRRIELAIQSQTDLTIDGVRGCESETIAAAIANADGADVDIIDGSIMDAELLDAALGGCISTLGHDEQIRRIVIIRQANETPPDAQSRLIHWKSLYGQRLRLIALTVPTGDVEEMPGGAAKLPGEAAAASQRSGLLPSLANDVATLCIELTPIVDRNIDLPLIATAAADAVAAESNSLVPVALSRSCLLHLSVFPWPGDMTELIESVRSASQAAIRRQKQFNPSSRSEIEIQIDDLPLAIRSYQLGPKETPAKIEPLDETIRQHEADRIAMAIGDAKGNRAAAARSLGISRARLLRKIDELVLAHLITEDGQRCRSRPD